MKLKTLLAFAFALAISASAQLFTSPDWLETKWNLAYSNSNDGWRGPMAIVECTKYSDKILRIIPLNYQPFNTNAPVNGGYITNTLQSSKIVFTYNGLVFNYDPIRTNVPIVIPGNEITIATNDWYTITNYISKSVEDGTFCSVRGHTWESGCGMIGCLVIHGDEPMRHCRLCKKTETRELGPWK